MEVKRYELQMADDTMREFYLCADADTTIAALRADLYEMTRGNESLKTGGPQGHGEGTARGPGGGEEGRYPVW
jgi:hypothetical protein